MEPYKWWVDAYPSVQKLSRFLLKDKSDTLSSKYVRADFRQHGGKYKNFFLKYLSPPLFFIQKSHSVPEVASINIYIYSRAYESFASFRMTKCIHPRLRMTDFLLQRFLRSKDLILRNPQGWKMPPCAPSLHTRSLKGFLCRKPPGRKNHGQDNYRQNMQPLESHRGCKDTKFTGSSC